MTINYEAVIVTTGGTFRAAAASRRLITVTEDGQVGVRDYIELGEDENEAGAPERLAATLTWWIYEHVRGVDVTSIELATRS